MVATNPGSVLVKAAQDKHDKYDGDFVGKQDAKFAAFAMETTGGFHEECLPIMKKLARKFSGSKSIPFHEQLKRMFTKLSVVSVKRTAKALLARTNC